MHEARVRDEVVRVHIEIVPPIRRALDERKHHQEKEEELDVVGRRDARETPGVETHGRWRGRTVGSPRDPWQREEEAGEDEEQVDPEVARADQRFKRVPGDHRVPRIRGPLAQHAGRVKQDHPRHGDAANAIERREAAGHLFDAFARSCNARDGHQKRNRPA